MPYFLHEALLRALADSIHKNGHRRAQVHLQLQNLNEQKVEELLYLPVFVWSPRIEEWPR